MQAVKKAMTGAATGCTQEHFERQAVRRIWMYCAEEKSVTEIAKLEGVTKASISLSLTGR